MNGGRRGKALPPPSTSRKRRERKAGRILPLPAAAVDDNGNFEQEAWPLKPKKKTVSLHLERLCEKRGSDREEALASIIEGLNQRLELNLLEEKFGTFLYRGLNSSRKGNSSSDVEKKLSLKVIGLLAVIVDCEDKLSELYRELLPLLSICLKFGRPVMALKVLDCLAIVGFFGATNSDETESAMQIIWEFINFPESAGRYGENTKKHSVEVLVAGIYAWLFLLSSMEGWRLSQNCWNGAISYFSNLFEHGDKCVRVAASEALALIFETGSLEKFWSEAKDPRVVNYSHMQRLLREMVLTKLKCLYLDIRGESSATKVRGVVGYFESFCCRGASLTVNGKDLRLSSWYQMIQLQYLKGFLADGFENHMTQNEKLQSLFEFNPWRNKNLGPELYVSTTDKISVRFFLPKKRDPETTTKEERKRERVWRTSLLEKARTQLMSKHRLLSREMNRCCND